MGRRTPRWTARALVTFTIVLVGSANAIALHLGVWREPSQHAVTLIFTTVGAVIASRRPDNRIGWLFVATGVGSAWLAAANQYAQLAMGGGGPPGALVVGALGVWGWIGGMAAVVLAMLHLPDGRLRGRRWRTAVAVTVLGAALIGASEMFASWAVYGYPVENPFHHPGLSAFLEPVFLVGVALLSAGIVAAIVQLILRFRGSAGDERQQVKWIVAGCVAGTIVFATNDLTTRLPLITHGLVAAVAVSLVPLAVGVAVLRYRLYDIDRIVRRTIAYAVVTAALVALYAALVVGFGALLRPITTGSDLTVAASTLGVAAAFGPVRRRVQRMVDRRFNRSRYDLVRTVEGFSHRIRDEVHLEQLIEDLAAVAARAVQPRAVGLWLRAPGPDHGGSRRVA